MIASPIELRKVWALTKRDIYNWSTYKSQILTTVATSVIGIASWGINADYRNISVPEYNTDYVSFLIVGILVTNLILPLGSGVQRQLNPWTLETIMMTGIKTPTFVLGTSLWTYILSVVLFIPQLALGIYVFHAVLVINLVSLVVSILISSLIIFCLAMISTGIRIVTKVTDPITWALAIAASVLSGLTYPVQELNNYVPGLSTVSWLLPQTWIYHIVRLSTLEAGSLLDPQIAEAFLITLGYAIVLVPISVYVYRWGLNRAKKDGTLGWY
jgi:ABC-type multidrug transport system permease subunit